MSDHGEKTCPLCTEEMDLTDQQLKPCKCGYEICVWCWHHIMDMAEKDETEGRCPACRTPYDKEKIVGMASNCERLIAEINSERKSKSQKVRPKTSEGRKHLSSVRVIQRNLVYIIGIPSSLADEDLLQRKEYFGQYGKVLKVSIARTAGGAIQHTSNNTCSVYITYSKEEEAVRCIQSVHGYSLEGKPLRACFGTTKYCHAWLRNMPCSNPDCLYLHDIGTQEDSFTKDEIISAYTRSRVQQIAGTTNNLQRRSGSTLPPPVDDFCNSTSASSAKPIAKTVTNLGYCTQNPVSQSKGSPPNDMSGRSAALPAAASWGLRVVNGRPPTASSSCLNVSVKQKPDDYNGSFPPVGATFSHGSTLHSEEGKKSMLNEGNQVLHLNGGLGSSESSKQCDIKELKPTISESHVDIVRNVAAPAVNLSAHTSCLSASNDGDSSDGVSTNISNLVETDRQSCRSTLDKEANTAVNGTIPRLSTGLSPVGPDEHVGIEREHVLIECHGCLKLDESVSNLLSVRSPRNKVVSQYHYGNIREPLILPPSRNAANTTDEFPVSKESPEWRSDSLIQVLPDAVTEGDENPQALDDERSKFSEVKSGDSWFSVSNELVHVDGRTVDAKVDNITCPLTSTGVLFSDGPDFDYVNSSIDFFKTYENHNSCSNVEKEQYSGGFNETNIEKTASVDTGENSIISNILSLDLDPWDDSLTSPHNLAKLLRETDKQIGSLKISSSLRVQNSNQSRFSFARQEDFANQHSDMEPSCSDVGLMTKHTVPQDHLVNGDLLFERLQNGFSSNMPEESDPYAANQYFTSSNKLSVSRAQVSAPPGFSVPSRAPPPGFSSQERIEQAFDSISGNHLLESTLLRNQYASVQPTGGLGNAADVELIDPAILAVGKGRLPIGINNSSFDLRSTFTPQLTSSENDPRLQMLMQQSIPAHQNLRYADHIGDRFSSLSDAFGIPSRHLDQSQLNNLSPFMQYPLQSRNAHNIPNGHWDTRNEVHSGNDLILAEILRKERLGFNSHFPATYEDVKYRIPGSGDLYNRAYGI